MQALLQRPPEQSPLAAALSVAVVPWYVVLHKGGWVGGWCELCSVLYLFIMSYTYNTYILYIYIYIYYIYRKNDLYLYPYIILSISPNDYLLHRILEQKTIPSPRFRNINISNALNKTQIKNTK